MRSKCRIMEAFRGPWARGERAAASAHLGELHLSLCDLGLDRTVAEDAARLHDLDRLGDALLWNFHRFGKVLREFWRDVRIQQLVSTGRALLACARAGGCVRKILDDQWSGQEGRGLTCRCVHKFQVLRDF